MKRGIKITLTASVVVAVIAIASSVAGMATTNVTAPAQVTGLNITTTTSEMSMTWNAPDDGGSNITSYTVEIILNYSDASRTTTTTTTTSYDHSNSAVVGTFYEFRVRATNDVGDGPWSAQGGTQLVVLDPPAAPHVTVSATASSIDLSWAKPHDGSSPITGYMVEYKEDDPNATEHTASTSGTSWSHTAAVLGTTYAYRVLAISSVGDGPWSDKVTASLISPNSTVPAKITQLNATANSDYDIVLSWTAPDNGGQAITGYTVEYDDEGGKKFTETVSGTSWVHEAAHLGYEHSYRVYATNSIGNGSWSDTVTATAGEDPGS